MRDCKFSISRDERGTRRNQSRKRVSNNTIQQSLEQRQNQNDVTALNKPYTCGFNRRNQFHVKIYEWHYSGMGVPALEYI